MRRRDYLKAIGGGSIAGLAGCAGLFERQTPRTPPLPADRPAAVYYPSHYEGMKMVGVKEQDGYKAALTYSYAHRFWLMKPQGLTKVEIQPEDSIHLMPVIWDGKTGIIPPDLNPQVTLTQEGESVDQFAPWPMLSQPMGFHFGDNTQLPGDGTYTVEVSIGEPTTRRTGSLAANNGNTTFTFEVPYAESTRNEIAYTDVPKEKEGTAGAVDLMQMGMMPTSQVPAQDDLPGDVRGTATSGDADFVITILENGTHFGGENNQAYLAVSPRTPYNRTMLPMMSLSGTVTREGTPLFDGILQPSIDPDLHYHYGAMVQPIQHGDELTITVDSPPQTARHEGYETAFVDMPEMTLTL